MGNGAAVFHHEVAEEELSKPADGSDVETLEQAKKEIARLRQRIVQQIPLNFEHSIVICLVSY
jgi:hypothetical protein